MAARTWGRSGSAKMVTQWRAELGGRGGKGGGDEEATRSARRRSGRLFKHTWVTATAATRWPRRPTTAERPRRYIPHGAKTIKATTNLGTTRYIRVGSSQPFSPPARPPAGREGGALRREAERTREREKGACSFSFVEIRGSGFTDGLGVVLLGGEQAPMRSIHPGMTTTVGYATKLWYPV